LTAEYKKKKLRQ